MSEEIKEILEQLKDSVDYPKIDMPTFDGTDSEFIDNDTLLEPDKCKLLLDYITNLQQKVEQLEKENDDLKNRLDNEVAENTLRLKEVEQLENIRKEIKEYIEKHVVCCKNGDMLAELNVDDLLNILNKGGNKE